MLWPFSRPPGTTSVSSLAVSSVSVGDLSSGPVPLNRHPRRAACSWANFQSATRSAVVEAASARFLDSPSKASHLRGGGLRCVPYSRNRRGYILSRLRQPIRGISSVYNDLFKLPELKVCHSGKLAEYARYGVDAIDDLGLTTPMKKLATAAQIVSQFSTS